jgi:hypothetical protein
MAPFYEDFTDLLESLGRLVGGHQLWHRSFKGSPLRSVRRSGKGAGFRFYRGTPLVVATDFGIAAPLFGKDSARPGDWLRFAALARLYDCPLIALVPHDPGWWPASLMAHYKLVHWDASLSAGDVRRAIGMGHRISS